MLAYVNGVYEKKERETIPESKHPTFNLQMLQEGQAVSLLIYPNIPKPADLELVQTAVRKARTTNKGFWKGPDNVLSPMSFAGSLTQSKAHEPAQTGTVRSPFAHSSERSELRKRAGVVRSSRSA